MRKRSVGRPRGTDPAETRREILRAAEESFAAAGFAGATTRQVAARAGVNVATLHYHFGNKEKLYRAVLESAAASAALPEAAGVSPAERVAAAVAALLDLGWSRPSLARLRLLHGLSGPAGTRDAFEDPRAAFLARAIGDAGAAAALPPAEASRLVLALVDGALVAARNGASAEAPPPPTREAVIAAALRLSGMG